jgi:stearoyl-CoA desaturase (Delta-9 desaturase)
MQWKFAIKSLPDREHGVKCPDSKPLSGEHIVWHNGLVGLPWWGYVVITLVLTHITIAGVTIYLHRHQAHRGLDLHALPSHFFRFWLWLTTGMITKEWVAIHRKHHAKCESVEDPHSPQIFGINKVLWLGVVLYVKEGYNQETLDRYGHGTPDDWLERNVYAPHAKLGVVLMLLIDLLLFGIGIGALVWAVQMLWIPFWAAGVINGVGHYWGYRNFQPEDASRNIVPWGILIGGEELHNNHHAYASSAKLSNKWYELDIGWMYIRTLEMLGLAQVKKVAPRVRFNLGKQQCDAETLQAIITHRYDVLANYARSLQHTCAEEFHKLTTREVNFGLLRTLKHWLHRDADSLSERERAKLYDMLRLSSVLNTVYSMREELAALWGRSNATREQLVKQLEDWCLRAEQSGITALQDFSRRLRCYA